MFEFIPVKSLLVASFCIVLVGACWGQQPTSTDVEEGAASTRNARSLPDQWAALLQCPLECATDCRELLREVATNPSSAQASRKLAATLLEECGLPAGDPGLQTPKLIWAPEITYEEIRDLLPRHVNWSVVVVTGNVGPDGRISGARFLRKSPYEALNDRVIAAFSEALYRPSRSKAGYVAKKIDFVYRLEPR